MEYDTGMYKIVLCRLSAAHGNSMCNSLLCTLYILYISSVRWLKMQFQRLGLSRRQHSVNETSYAVVKHCIKVYLVLLQPYTSLYKIIIAQMELRTSNALLGYRSMWKHLRDVYRVIVPRYLLLALSYHS